MKLTRYPFIFILFFTTLYLRAQSDSNNYIPNITVAPPQVAAMSKVNEIPVDIATGRINYSIPIFDVKEGDFSMPINLSYNYSGLLVDETPGYAGVGWTFNIGGAVMQIVKGLNDEGRVLDKNMIYKYFNKLPPYQDENLPESKARILDLFEKVSEGRIDGRPDKYSINIGNINCSFYLDKDDNPIFLENKNYKLIKNGSSGFTLTDDKGINYIFSLSQISQSASSSSDLSSYSSSFLITEINFPYTNNKITFEYTAPNTLFDIYHSYTSANTITNSFSSWSTTKSRTETTSSVTKLSKITTNNYTIELQYDDNPAELAVAVVTKLEIKNKAGIAIKTYDFNYSQWSGRRKNLLDVKYNGQVINSMEYDESLAYPNFSEIDLAKKDLWGYYNSNGSLPLNNVPLNPLDNPGIKPDFTSTKIGSLKRITYQTKGYSLIEYEPNTVFMNVADYNLPYPNDSNVSKNLSATTINTGGSIITEFDVVSVPVTLNLYNVLSNDTQKKGWEDRNSQVMLFKQGEESNPIFERNQTWTKDGNWMPSQSSFINQTTINIGTPGKYYLKAISSVGSMANITTPLQQSAQAFNQTVGGIRVKEVKNCDFNGACITTTYNYAQSGKSTGIMLQKPKFYSGSFLTDRTTCLPAYGDVSTRTYYYSYNSVSPLSNFRGSPVLYKKVEQIEGNQLENNGRTVFLYSGAGVDFLHNEGYSIGQLDQKIVQSKTGDTIQKQKNTYSNHVKPNNPRFVLGLECKLTRTTFKMYGGLNFALNCSPTLPRPLSDFVTETFRSETENYFLQEEKNSSYFNGQEVTQTTTNNYNVDTGYLKNQTSTNSKGEILQSQYFYPADAEMAGEPLRDLLIAKNMVANPLKTQNYNGGNKLTEKVTKYNNYTVAGQSLILPQFIYAKKGNIVPDQLEKKVSYDNYDDRGNITQYTIENGAPVSIIWGYNKTLPIAKIENASNIQIATALGVADLNTVNESSLDAINNLRPALPNTMITTYTHIALVGVNTITDPKGDKITYTYDSLGRLQFVKDKNDKILSQNQYNYRP
ncbi:hypothetical protein Flavo103_44680 [Flavobacterium collinsii]|uniref:hypothetical protein n=1 Tax=Flavobacterium collinsii TaxID=1114861 RepID=UPI0022C8531C|nr:hypothetical protein [Flavobacterium collinsii]GIQ61333.1 hypothetical protein Flavo103_44680 [Flavobacterium collinsii]